MNVNKVVELVDESKKCEMKGADLLNKAAQLLAEARELCQHPATTKKEHYFEGGYLDKAYTTIHTHCAICGKEVGVDTIEHNWYG